MLGGASPTPQDVWLTLNASDITHAALVRDGAVLEDARDALAEGRPGRMAPLVAALWRSAIDGGLAFRGLAVIVGPGSFTGLRAAIALARGLSDASGLPVIGVTVGEAVFAEYPDTRCVVTAAGAGRFVAERGFPDPSAELLRSPPEDATARVPSPRGIASAALQRASGAWPPRALLPLYATPPAATVVAARPPPA